MSTSLLLALLACSQPTPDAASPQTHASTEKGEHAEKGEQTEHTEEAEHAEEAEHTEEAEHPEETGTDRGAEIFATNCASCHGAEGKGDGVASAALDPKPADLSVSRSGPHPSGKNRWQIILTGSEGTAMPAWEGVLSTEDLDALHGHIRSLLGDEATCGCGEHHADGETCGDGEGGGHGAGGGGRHGAGGGGGHGAGGGGGHGAGQGGGGHAGH